MKISDAVKLQKGDVVYIKPGRKSSNGYSLKDGHYILVDKYESWYSRVEGVLFSKEQKRLDHVYVFPDCLDSKKSSKEEQSVDSYSIF